MPQAAGICAAASAKALPQLGTSALGVCQLIRCRHCAPPPRLPAAKMGCKAAALQRALWGEYAYQPKTKRIVRIKVGGWGSRKTKQ